MDFADSVYARDFFQGQLPDLIRTLKRIADNQEKMMPSQPQDIAPAKVENTAVQGETVYVCYEENSTYLYSDAGNINHMFVTLDMEQARRWAAHAFKHAEENKYLPIDKAEKDQFLAELGIEQYASVWVYLGRKEDARENYGICVDCFDLSKGADYLGSLFK